MDAIVYRDGEKLGCNFKRFTGIFFTKIGEKHLREYQGWSAILVQPEWMHRHPDAKPTTLKPI